MAWHSSTTFIVFLLYYLLSAVSGQLEPDACLSLSSSEACRAFDQYYISLSDALTSAYPFLSNITTVQSFDNAMYAHVAGASVLQQLGCNNTQDKAYYPRYSLSRLCATLVHEASGSTTCNYIRNINPRPLCQSTCNTWIDSLQNMTSTDAVCPSALYGSLRTECFWPAFVGQNGSCVQGSANEPDNCGFHDDRTHACEYCQSNSNDACCQSLSCSSNLSAGVIAGIVVGAVAGVGILIFALYFIFFRRRRDNARFLPITTHADTGMRPGREDDEAREHLVDNGTLGTVPTIGITTAPTSVEMEEKTQLPSPNPVEMAELFCEVVHSYPPQEEDELDIREGDIVYLIFQLDDGWGYGLNVATSQMGVFPLVCVMRAREELLEQLLLSPSDQVQFTNDKTLAEDEEQILPEQQRNGKSPTQLEKSPTSVSNSSLLAHRMQQIRDDVRRSISVTSLRRISRQPRAAPPVQVHHHDTMPTKRVTDALSPQQQLFSAPPTVRPHHYADSIPSPRLPPPPPPPHQNGEETFEMHHPNPSLQ
ncbi:hypothetical protein BJV82DRAFT_666116 [Fennellomyces sp. T-0311]|nr:hypothetical protein BJV82DRAFT_666116 [Fennellomyces sp. T-0311]